MNGGPLPDTIYLATDDGAWVVRDGRAAPMGLGGKSVSLIVQQPDEPGILHAGAWGDGVYRSTDGGQQWARVLEADVWTLAQRPDRPELLYAGVEPAGVYRSTDFGQTWTELDAIYKLPTYNQWWFPPPPHIAHVTSFVLHPQALKVVYAGVEVGGVIVSRDGGRTWAELHKGLHDDIHWMACSPGGDYLYAATAAGFYRSDDGGESWRRSDRGLDRHYAYCIARVAGPEERLVMAVSSGPDADDSLLFLSTDGGAHWAKATRDAVDGRMKVAAHPAREGACYASQPDGTLLRSDDAGETWAVVARDLPYVNGITVYS